MHLQRLSGVPLVTRLRRRPAPSYSKNASKEQRIESLEAATVVAMTADPEILKLVMSDEISDQDSTEMSMAIMLALGKQCPQKMTDMVNDMGE